MYFLKFIFYCSITVVPLFPHCSAPSAPPVNPRPIDCAYESSIHVPWLALSPKFSVLFKKLFLIYFKLYFYCWHYYRCPYSSPLPTSPQPLPPLPLAVPTLPSVSVGRAYMFSGWSLHLLSSSAPSPSPPTAVSLFQTQCSFYSSIITKFSNYAFSFPFKRKHVTNHSIVNDLIVIFQLYI